VRKKCSTSKKSRQGQRVRRRKWVRPTRKRKKKKRSDKEKECPPGEKRVHYKNVSGMKNGLRKNLNSFSLKKRVEKEKQHLKSKTDQQVE